MNTRILGLVVAAVSGIALLAPVGSARANLITGQFSAAGTDTVNLTAQTISFVSAANILAGTETGSFLSVLGSGTVAITMLPTSTTNYAVSNAFAGIQLITGPNGLTLTANTSSFTQSGTNASGSLDLFGSGTLTLTGFTPTNGIWRVTTQTNGAPTVSFSASVAVPSPTMGAGIPGLILAAGAALFALGRRRRRWNFA